MLRHKKYQGIEKFYLPGDDIGSWLRNLETILYDDNIPEEDWAFILWKNLSSEPLKIAESVPDDQLNEYDCLKELISQQFRLTELEQRKM